MGILILFQLIPVRATTGPGYEFGDQDTSITKPDGGVTTNTYDDTEEENLDMPTGTIATQISPDGGETSGWSFGDIFNGAAPRR